MDQGILMMCKASAEKKLWYFGSFKIFLLQKRQLAPPLPAAAFPAFLQYEGFYINQFSSSGLFF